MDVLWEEGNLWQKRIKKLKLLISRKLELFTNFILHP